MRRPVLLVAVAAALAGCGQSGPTDEELVARAVAAFGRATAAKDYAALCSRLLSPALVSKVEEIGLPCTRALATSLGEVENPRLTVGTITVEDDHATAQIRTSASGQAPSSDTLELSRVDGTWRITSLGAAG